MGVPLFYFEAGICKRLLIPIVTDLAVLFQNIFDLFYQLFFVRYEICVF